jgi:hypothetical protein
MLALHADKSNYHYAKNSLILACKSLRFFVWHSQITRTSHPRSARRARLRSSLLLFVSSFGTQNSSLDFGSLASGQAGSECMCQKQPCTKRTFLRRAKTRSGTPGRSRRCSRYRYPMPWTSRRTSISGLVSRPRTRPMRALRCSGVRVSMPYVERNLKARNARRTIHPNSVSLGCIRTETCERGRG